MAARIAGIDRNEEISSLSPLVYSICAILVSVHILTFSGCKPDERHCVAGSGTEFHEEGSQPGNFECYGFCTGECMLYITSRYLLKQYKASFLGRITGIRCGMSHVAWFVCRRYARVVYAVVVSVRPSVHHRPTLYKNG